MPNLKLALGPGDMLSLIGEAVRAVNQSGQKLHRVEVDFAVSIDPKGDFVVSDVVYYPVDENHHEITTTLAPTGTSSGGTIRRDGCPYPPDCTGIGFLPMREECVRKLKQDPRNRKLM
jgi:hypothetical protein